ncbi:hypothetical protein H112_07313 [Trichophyton rubrum D6]|nr:uncharacterized protein TERG_02636 [Trichophyton rubrum CBS 118892]EZF11792.1 hypothetical protein H100_07340 [Trichophyton rubrum MR850]EZF38509.1 hypothetical protein H102_07301 [Trichophyton rubrum CBS 100081]EZF49205.1 hypothetical protein H103_07324 [Trichophyton rubrum CBS 288.86]EZF59849.1 hypothetical protein H104_07276 [Trichophyton rubrum CBS 289.86]EZF81050.1 hypothetical protein H110_07322 [Trichophyton rubrum MR1448]EZF91890.1 hypothetical protein H113_07375 [Trichophyton rubr
MPGILLSQFPDEILHSILTYTPPSAAIALEQTSKRFSHITNAPLLWAGYCKASFRFWDKRHDITDKFARPAKSVQWKELYKLRHQIDRSTTEILDSILASQTGRIEKIHRIVSFGYDAKDTLIRHADAPQDLEDYLARRYYSNAILGCLHRTLAIPTWNRLRNGEDVSLEHALGAFDMFILDSGTGDFDDISRSLNNIVGRMKRQYPNILEYTPRERAIMTAEYLRENNLTGIESGREFYNIEHNFLGAALTSERHNSLPLISAAIYCYVAQRLGLDAHPCGFPFHVHVIIRPEPNHDLAGNRLPDGEEGDFMYMDPFRSTSETPVSELQSQLNFLGALTLSQSTFLRESFTAEIVLRCGKNILNSVLQTPHFRQTSLDIVNVKYAALWASMLFAKYANPDRQNIPQGPERRRAEHLPLRRHLPSLMEHFATDFPADVYLIEQYLIPLFQSLPEYEHLRESVSVMKASDEIPKQVRRRNSANGNVKYKVGQLFRHKRYEYIGLITGWDPECGAGEQWMERMGVDRLHAGRHQSFYHVLVEDKSVRYVAEENIEICELEASEVPDAFFSFAGKFFKRWDIETRRFVSNIRDEYPDD